MACTIISVSFKESLMHFLLLFSAPLRRQKVEWGWLGLIRLFTSVQLKKYPLYLASFSYCFPANISRLCRSWTQHSWALFGSSYLPFGKGESETHSTFDIFKLLCFGLWFISEIYTFLWQTLTYFICSLFWPTFWHLIFCIFIGVPQVVLLLSVQQSWGS